MAKHKTIFILALVVSNLAVLSRTEAQKTEKVRRIGLLFPGSLSYGVPNIEAFRHGLRQLGYIEGKNILVDYRVGDGKLDQYPRLAAELVSLNVEVIVTASAPAVQAVRNATSTIPIVIAAAANPDGAGLITSLSRPGGT